MCADYNALFLSLLAFLCVSQEYVTRAARVSDGACKQVTGGARSNDSKQFGWRAVLSCGSGRGVLGGFCFASSHLLRTREEIFI